MSVALALTRSPTDAEDLVQDTSVKAWRNIKRYNRKLLSMQSWFYLIMRRLWIDELRRRKLMVVPLNEALNTKGGDSPEDETIAAWILDDALALMDPVMRAAILNLLDGYTDAETAKITGMSQGAVRIRAHRARRLLKAAWEIDEFIPR